MPLVPGLEEAVTLTAAPLAGGIVAGVVLSRWPRLCGWACSLAVAAALAASGWLGVLVYGGTGAAVSLGGNPSLPIDLSFDRLNLIFIWLVLGIGLLATIYSVRYIERSTSHEGTPALPVLRYYPVLVLFLSSMVFIVCVKDLLLFFIAWSIMSLCGLALILHEYHKPEVLAAGIKFALFTLVGNAAIFAAIMILHNESGSFTFLAAQQTMSALLRGGSWMPHLVFGLFLLGFMTKLGIYPMGDWLPDAHPAAPSPVSALLSGVMIKLAAYDIAHISGDLMIRWATSGSMMAWGMVLACFGAASVLLGGSAAAVQTDTKRLLAYSSVSQSGYILICLGVSMALMPVDPRLGALAFVAAFVFVVADALHKSLLFLTAGSVLHATGTRDLLQLGGLGERMPSTTFAAIAGGLSLAGIPLTAGFVAKWILLQATLEGAGTQPLLAVFALVIVIGSILGIAYALKYVGAAYLGAPASPECCDAAQEVPLGMRLPQTVLVLALIAAGLWPALMVIPALGGLSYAASAAMPLEGLDSGLLLLSGDPGVIGGFVPLVVLALMVVAGLLALGLARVAGAPVREVPSWQSGLDLPLALTRLPASGWYWPFTPLLRSVYREIRLPAALNPAASTASERDNHADERETSSTVDVMQAADGGE